MGDFSPWQREASHHVRNRANVIAGTWGQVPGELCFRAGTSLPLEGPLASREGLQTLRLLGGSLWASWTGVTCQGCFQTSTCWSVASRDASIGSLPEPEAPLAQLSGQERSSTTMMGAWVPGRLAAAPGSSL